MFAPVEAPRGCDAVNIARKLGKALTNVCLSRRETDIFRESIVRHEYALKKRIENKSVKNMNERPGVELIRHNGQIIP
jgi:hypothetical protein